VSLTEVPPVVVGPTDKGIGLVWRTRRSDCAGRPSWYPFVYNVCDVDNADPVPFTDRMMHLPPAPIPAP
jgi:hypothetical protein